MADIWERAANLLTVRRYRITVFIILGVFMLYLIMGLAFWRVDDDLDFAPPETSFWRNPTVGVFSDLLYRELIKHPWKPNKPSFLPGITGLARPSAFQTGIVEGVAATVATISLLFPESAGFAIAASDLQYPPNIGFFTFSREHPATSHRMYQDGMRVLDSLTGMQKYALTYSHELALLSAMADALRRMDGTAGASDIDALFYRRRGRIYADRIIFKTLALSRSPAAAGIGEAFDRAVAYQRFFVFPNHILTQSRYAGDIADALKVFLEKQYGNE